jgi:hypothetical protein
MRVNPNSETSGVVGVPSRTTARTPRLGQDNLALTSTDRIEASLAQTPAVRAERVAEAKKLVLDSSYPPEELINKLSALLASYIDPKNNSK